MWPFLGAEKTPSEKPRKSNEIPMNETPVHHRVRGWTNLFAKMRSINE